MDDWWFLDQFEGLPDINPEYPYTYPDKEMLPVPAHPCPQAQLTPASELTYLLYNQTEPCTAMVPNEMESGESCEWILPSSENTVPTDVAQVQPRLPPQGETCEWSLPSPENTVPTDVAQAQPRLPPQETPRQIRNKEEKNRRDKFNKSIEKLASIVPPIVRHGKKVDKTSVLRLAAHYLRSHHYVFGDSLAHTQQFSTGFIQTFLKMQKGFLITTTYKGTIVVASSNIEEYLGYNEIELLGQNVFNIVHEDDHDLLRKQLMPATTIFGNDGQLIIPDGQDATKKVADLLANEKRSFIIRFKKTKQQRSEPPQYVTCHVEGSFRKADKACSSLIRYTRIVRRARSKGEKKRSSGNDVVFIGLVRPTSESFFSESALESFRMEYRTRHSVDGAIIQTEHKISLVTGYMVQEVNGANAMSFMHRDDVRWVLIALRQMLDQNRSQGESCYRLITKNGKFIYMRTCGRLYVDQYSKGVSSLICTNTVLDEQEGSRLVKLMKRKFSLMLNKTDDSDADEEDNK